MEVDQALKHAKLGEVDNLKSIDIKEHGIEKFVDGRGAGLAHYAARGGHVPVLEYLVEEGVSITCRSAVGATPAHDAAATGNTDALLWLLKNSDCGTEGRDEGGCTVVHLCALYGHLRATKWLVTEGGASISDKTKSGALPLHFAATRGDLDTVKFLVEQRPGHAKEVDDDSKDYTVSCPCCNADQTVNAQLDSGATAAYLASQEGHLEVLEYLVEEGEVSTKIRCYDGMSCLHAAAQMGHLPCVRWLVEAQKLRINDRDFDGATPLHFAAGQGHVDVIEWLVEKGAKVSKDSLGGTPLHTAAEHGNLQCVRVLLKQGVDSGVEDNDGLTAAHLAELCWQAECAAAIKRRASQVGVVFTRAAQKSLTRFGDRNSNRKGIVALGNLNDEPMDRFGSPIYDEVGPRFRNVRDSIRFGKGEVSEGKATRPVSLPPPPTSFPPPPPPNALEEESPSLVSTASQTSLDYENLLPGMKPPIPSAPAPPPPPPMPPLVPAPPPPPLLAPSTPNSTLNSRKSGSTNHSSRPGTLTKNKQIFGSNQELDLLAELKAANGMMSLKKTKKRDSSGGRTVYSSGTSSPVPERNKKEAISPSLRPPRAGPGGKAKPNLVGEYDPKKFLDKVPEKDTAGKDIPPWKKLIVARQLAEKAMMEDAERKKREEEEAKYKNMPVWKKALLEKKGILTEPKSEGKGESKLPEPKTAPDQNNGSLRSPDTLEVPIAKGQDLDEDGLPLPPWKKDIRAGQTPIQV